MAECCFASGADTDTLDARRPRRVGRYRGAAKQVVCGRYHTLIVAAARPVTTLPLPRASTAFVVRRRSSLRASGRRRNRATVRAPPDWPAPPGETAVRAPKEMPSEQIRQGLSSLRWRSSAMHGHVRGRVVLCGLPDAHPCWRLPKAAPS